MIDSVLLQLHSGQFSLREKNRFNERTLKLARGYSTDTEFSFDYMKSWQKKGIYCPLFGLPTRKQGLSEPQKCLEIQVSLQKLVHGTNLFDVDESDLPIIWKKLLFFLGDLGADTTIEDLQKAIVRRADFSKIIKLLDYLGRADEVIRTLWQFDYKPQSEFRYREYGSGNEGVVMKFWNSTQGYAIYDKFGEIISQGFTKQEMKLIELYKQGKQPRNAIKFELSLQRKDSLEAVVRRRVKTGKKKDFYLEELLNRDLAQAILCDAFEKVFSSTAVGLITLSQMEESRLFTYLESSELSQAMQEKLYYWVRMGTKFGIAGTWEQIKQKHKGGSIGRRKEEIALILQELGQISGNVPNLIEFLRVEHEKFELIKPKCPL